MADIIKMSYEEMATMATRFDTSAQNVDAVATAMKSIVGLLHDGALTGPPGVTFENAVNSFIAKLKTLEQDLENLKTDINKAMADMQSGDQSGASGFHG